MLQKVMFFALTVSLSLNVSAEEFLLPFKIPDGFRLLDGTSVEIMLSGNCLRSVAGPDSDWKECFDPTSNGISARVIGKYRDDYSGAIIEYSQPSDWRVQNGFLCYRLQNDSHIDSCYAVAIDQSSGEVVGFSLDETRLRDWEVGSWRARIDKNKNLEL